LNNYRKKISETPTGVSPSIRLKPLNIERFNPQNDFNNKKKLVIKHKRISKKHLIPEKSINLERYSNYSSVDPIDTDINEEIELEQPSPHESSKQLEESV